MDSLAAANNDPCKENEIEIIRKVCQDGEIRAIKPTRIDVYLESYTG